MGITQDSLSAPEPGVPPSANGPTAKEHGLCKPVKVESSSTINSICSRATSSPRPSGSSNGTSDLGTKSAVGNGHCNKENGVAAVSRGEKQNGLATSSKGTGATNGEVHGSTSNRKGEGAKASSATSNGSLSGSKEAKEEAPAVDPLSTFDLPPKLTLQQLENESLMEKQVRPRVSIFEQSASLGSDTNGRHKGKGSAQDGHNGWEDDSLAAQLQDKQARRKLSNRQSARRSRLRRQTLLGELQEKVSQYQRENQQIVMQIEDIMRFTHGKMIENQVLEEEVARLRAQVVAWECEMECKNNGLMTSGSSYQLAADSRGNFRGPSLKDSPALALMNGVGMDGPVLVPHINASGAQSSNPPGVEPLIGNVKQMNGTGHQATGHAEDPTAFENGSGPGSYDASQFLEVVDVGPLGNGTAPLGLQRSCGNLRTAVRGELAQARDADMTLTPRSSTQQTFHGAQAWTLGRAAIKLPARTGALMSFPCNTTIAQVLELKDRATFRWAEFFGAASHCRM
eukprot:scaffold1379_cov390-Prasinococcus_capsulatus_cf.AAC.2